MICPQTKAECGHLAFGDITGKCMEQEVGTMDQVDAEVRRAISLAEPPPPPTLAKIGGLAVAYGNACVNFSGSGHGSPDVHFAALMAAIQKYGS